ncbi:LLM class flavin-dependent oxidoreductase [Streptomyces griseocarneus]|uniref:LLM class flavin-dependent oxidoreductase n=1 Tax=Streptomyces griseocarneus TaxID=51201 RepID=UPI001F61D6FA|nr:LLM class flavin-dependent oxidoreductase [Streptomyces griseocarneus]
MADSTTTPLRIGVLLPTREQAITDSFAADPLLDFARQAEQLGFDSLWAGDSLTARPRLDPLVVLSAAGAVTSRVTLGTAALTPALRHPLVGANMISSLDHVCGSRLVLGLGSGFPMPETEAEFASVGASFKGRVGRLDDIVGLWRTAWGSDRPGAPTDYDGKYWQAEGLDRLPRPHRPGGPPLWLAGSDTPRVLERVARDYDGWLPFLPSAEAYGVARARIAELVEEAGRPADAVTPPSTPPSPSTATRRPRRPSSSTTSSTTTDGRWSRCRPSRPTAGAPPNTAPNGWPRTYGPAPGTWCCGSDRWTPSRS